MTEADKTEQESAELESFRKQWREEVSRRSKQKGASLPKPPAAPIKGQPGSSKQAAIVPPTYSEHAAAEAAKHDSFEGYSFHDLEDKEEGLKLGASSEARRAALGSEPKSALDHYEKAVERESVGKMGDSVSLYRKAFKLDDGVHEAYKQKHFASSWKKPPPGAPKQPATAPAVSAPAQAQKPTSITELIASFAELTIPPMEPETSLSETLPCPISGMPIEILETIFNGLAAQDPANLARLAPVCKRMAYLISSCDSVWRKIFWSPLHGITTNPYRYVCDLRGTPLLDPHSVDTSQIPDLTPSVHATYRAQFRHRPRIRFGGCYISTVNYTRPGGYSLNQYGEDGRPSRSAWNAASPVHIVTYYRYLRFYRDGTVISLLTTAEPADVVHFLGKEFVPEQAFTRMGMREHYRPPRHAPSEDKTAANAQSSLPQNVMKEALLGRWRLSGPASGPSPRLDDDADEQDLGTSTRPGEYAKEPLSEDALAAAAATGEEPPEEEGTVHVETQGVVPKYMWKMAFALGSSGRRDGAGPRSNKLSWKGFWSYNRLSDDWGEFSLRHDRPFYWSRVKSYGVGC